MVLISMAMMICENNSNNKRKAKNCHIKNLIYRYESFMRGEVVLNFMAVIMICEININNINTTKG